MTAVNVNVTCGKKKKILVNGDILYLTQIIGDKL